MKITRKTDLTAFKEWLFDQGLERQSAYNYVSRVRHILKMVPSLDPIAVDEAMEQLASTSIPKSAFRTPWRHFIEFMAYTHKVKLEMPPSARNKYTKIKVPATVMEALYDLVHVHHYSPKLIASCRWAYFTPDAGRKRWIMKHPEHPGERWYPKWNLILTLFQWSSSCQPDALTPLVAVKPDSEVPFTPTSISKMLRHHKKGM